MSRRLLTVESTFSISGRGLVLLPWIIPKGDEPLHVGDRVTLRQPDGSSSEVRIVGLEHISPSPQNAVVILLKGTARRDVPAGTEVWSTNA